MPRAVRSAARRTAYRDRHGRGIRSSVTGPHLAPLVTRESFFESCVASAVDYLRALWPGELDGVSFDVAGVPSESAGRDGIDRWKVSRRDRRVVLYRLPIERLAHLHRDDEWHRRSLIESCVFRAVAELLGRDPWEIAPERFRHF